LSPEEDILAEDPEAFLCDSLVPDKQAGGVCARGESWLDGD